MKTLRQITTATILSLTLAISAFGGHIETPGAPAPRSASTTTEVPTYTTTDVTTDIVLTVVSVVYP